jgi:hypothetical protein
MPQSIVNQDKATNLDKLQKLLVVVVVVVLVSIDEPHVIGVSLSGFQQLVESVNGGSKTQVYIKQKA